MILPLLLPPLILYPQLLFKLLTSSFVIVLYAHSGIYKCNQLSLFGVAHIYMCSQLITSCGTTYHMARRPWKRLIYFLYKPLLACSSSSSKICKISPIHVIISTRVVIMKALFR